MVVWLHCPAHTFSKSYTWFLGLISSKQYNKRWDAPTEEANPAQLLLFAHCEIKEMAQKKKTAKDM